MLRNFALIAAIGSLLLFVQTGDSAPRRRAPAASPAVRKVKGALRISVIGDNGRHAGHAHVRVINHIGKRRHAVNRRANAAGAVAMNSLAPGQYVIRASGAHRAHGAATTLVSPGAITRVTIGMHGGVHRAVRTLAFIETRIHADRPTHHLFALGRPKPHGPIAGKPADTK